MEEMSVNKREECHSRRPYLVIGMGLSGRAASEYLMDLGCQVIGVDRKSSELQQLPLIQKQVVRGLHLISEECFLADTSFNWDAVEGVILSPGIPDSNPVYKSAVDSGKEIIGEVELAAKALSKNKWIGVTGTNGKTTVTLLISHILNEVNIRAKALGNVGVPLSSSILDMEDEVIVAELSSYQLETMKTPILDCAVILNITPDHLDRYSSFQSYAKAKFRINDCLKKCGHLYINESIIDEFNSFVNQDLRFFRAFGYSSQSFIFSDLESLFIEGKKVFALPAHLQGKKSADVENLMAAYALCRELGVRDEDFLKKFSTFKKPSHRVEFVSEVNGVGFYDDSKGTNLDAVIRAVESIGKPIVLIAGGVHKGASYKPWIQAFQGKVRAVCAIGEAAGILHEDLSAAMPVFICASMEEAVRKSAALCNRGDCVVLSPGCSSFDMFRDYAHRGDEFKKHVWAIPQGNS